VLHAAGVTLRLDDGDLLVGGTPKGLAVWSAPRLCTAARASAVARAARTDSGYLYIDAEGLAWRMRRNAARARNQPFNEPPPYRWPFN
jgi:hypothetical protein